MFELEKVIASGAKTLASTFDEWCKKKYPERYEVFIKYKKLGKIYKLMHPEILIELVAKMEEMNKERINESNKEESEN